MSRFKNTKRKRMQKEVKKTYLGCVEINDRFVNECLDKKENLVVLYDGDRMTLTPEELKGKEVKLHNSDKVYTSRIKGGPSYKLVAFEWNPDEIDL
jgi:hypothetical protein